MLAFGKIVTETCGGPIRVPTSTINAAATITNASWSGKEYPSLCNPENISLKKLVKINQLATVSVNVGALMTSVTSTMSLPVNHKFKKTKSAEQK